MIQRKTLAVLISAIIINISMEAATVSIVNETQPGALTTQGSSVLPTTSQATQQSNQYTQSQVQKPGGTQTGKLPTTGRNAKPPRKPKLIRQPVPKHIEKPVYTFPGLVAKLGNRWVGSDYLYDLDRNIGIKLEIVKEEGKNIEINGGDLVQIVGGIFNKANINPESFSTDVSPPLPFFHVLIFAFPNETTNVAFVTGRLFEEAKLGRFDLQPIGTWQVITWEKQDLIISSPYQFDEQLKKSIANIAETFVERIEFYARVKEESESNVKLYYPTIIPPTPPPPPPKPAEAPSRTLTAEDCCKTFECCEF